MVVIAVVVCHTSYQETVTGWLASKSTSFIQGTLVLHWRIVHREKHKGKQCFFLILDPLLSPPTKKQMLFLSFNIITENLCTYRSRYAHARAHTHARTRTHTHAPSQSVVLAAIRFHRILAFQLLKILSVILEKFHFFYLFF